MMRIPVVAIAACGAAAPPAPPPAVPPASPEVTVTKAPAGSGNATLELVARCATRAVELLGWNPLPDGAHRGKVIATSIEHGGSADCTPLVTAANTVAFALAGTQVDWDWGPKDEPDATAIQFRFTCAGCTPIETTVTLPRRWHCFGWIEREHHGTVCLPDAAACERARGGHATKTPCTLHTGHAWCQVGTTTCSDSPWSCLNSPRRTPCEKAP
jgi:hypothetical protein